MYKWGHRIYITALCGSHRKLNVKAGESVGGLWLLFKQSVSRQTENGVPKKAAPPPTDELKSLCASHSRGLSRGLPTDTFLDHLSVEELLRARTPRCRSQWRLFGSGGGGLSSIACVLHSPAGLRQSIALRLHLRGRDLPSRSRISLASPTSTSELRILKLRQKKKICFLLTC